MDNLLPNELEELILCSCCHLTFNDTDAIPKLFSCRHYFCLKCINTILLKGKELYCIHCWKRTELPQADMKPESLPTYNAILYLSQNMINIKVKKLMTHPESDAKNQFPSTSSGAGTSGGGAGTSNSANVNLNSKARFNESCLTHAMPNSLWCLKCNEQVCRACATAEEHRNHTIKSQSEAKETIYNDILSDLMKMQKKLAELQHLVFKQRDFLLKILEGCTTLKSQIETELINHLPTLEISDIRSHLAKAKLTLTLMENQQSPAEAYKLFNSLQIEKHRLQTKYNEMLLQCKLEDLIQHYGSLLDFDLLKQISVNLNSGIEASFSFNANNASTSHANSLGAKTGTSAVVGSGLNHLKTSSKTNNSSSTNNDSNNNSETNDHKSNKDSIINNGSDSNDTNNNSHSNSNCSSNLSTADKNNPNSSYATLNYNRVFINLGHNNLILLLANYCVTQLYSHHILTSKTLSHMTTTSSSPMTSLSLPNTTANCSSNLFLGGLGMVGIVPDQYQLSSSMQEHLMQKYSELTSSSPATTSTNPLNYLQSNEMIGNGSLASGSGGSYVSVARQLHRPTTTGLGQSLQTPPPHPPPFISAAELNGMSMPIAIIQHHLQQQSSAAHLHHHSQQQSNGVLIATTSAISSSTTTNSQASTSIVQNPTVHVYPIYFFNIEINGNPFGRILIEVRSDVAPKMAKNFGALCTGELGFGYKGCHIFQCWENESIITGDFELNNGRGGRSVFEESFFMPDDTKILAIRGSVGMRRSQKRHDNMGLVGSQFRIILREMRGFTGIFAFVVEGLDLVDKISKAGDSAGKPQSNVIIVNCGKWQ